MRPRDLALAVAVMAAWGVNFVMIDTGLTLFPPLMFNALRFTLAAFPAVFFVGRPQVPWRWVIAVGLALGVTKFSLLFAGMAAGMPAGLSSLVLQSQAVFTVLYAVLLLRERPRAQQVAGLAVAFAGIVVVGSRMGSDLGAFLLIIGAAAAWGLSNIATRKASPPDTLRFMVWVSAVASGPLILLTLLIEGPSRDAAALAHLSLKPVLALAYVVVVATLAGFGGWGYLIRRYGAATVAPFSMLVPIFGIAAGALMLGERVHPVDVAGGVLVIGGVLLGLVRYGPEARSRLRGRASTAPEGALEVASDGVSERSGSRPETEGQTVGSGRRTTHGRE
jgi:O-acetylserine/cysteine efflux transporter